MGGLTFVLGGGVFGYMVIEDWTVLDALYMTIITVATVGYREVGPLSNNGEVFTILLIVLGVGFAAYSFGTLLELMVEGGVQDILGRRRVERDIKKIKDHYIVCGYGRIGKVVVEELLKLELPLIVIETDATEVQDMLERGILAIQGNAGDESVLKRAGIERAKVLVCVAASDADNLFITITARDAFSNTITDFAQDVTPSTTNGGTVSPTLIRGVDFVAGVWTGTITLTGAGQDRVIIVSSGGVSNQTTIDLEYGDYRIFLPAILRNY